MERKENGDRRKYCYIDWLINVYIFYINFISISFKLVILKLFVVKEKRKIFWK